MRLSFLKLFLIFLLPACSLNIKAEPEIYIRLNQIGFLPGDIKTAVILSNNPLSSFSAKLKNSANGKEIWKSPIKNSITSYGSFKYSYQLDFSSITEKGSFFIEVGETKSFQFKIGDDIFNGVAESLLEFFHIQRCGYTNPSMHDVCHIADATKIINGKNVLSKSIDVTGGWHDAGDYIKFLNTTAYATYMLMFSYEFDPIKFGFDKNKNNIPDVLEEAKIGLDWLLRSFVDQKYFVTQVQDLRDHEYSWRLPENDPLAFDRPAYVGMSKNLIGIYSATMALASRIWLNKLNYKEYSEKCLKAAADSYALRNNVQDVDSSGSGMYIDKEFEGKLSLGAIELYLTTNKTDYLKDSKIYADLAGSDFWWSWGNINSLAHYRLAKFENRFGDYIKNNLDQFNKNKNNNLFGIGTQLSWGTNNTLLGITLQSILYKKLSNDSQYDSLAVFQRDYIMGRNPWGISFIYGFGSNFVKNLHHQISFLKGKLPGGFSAGPATKEFLKQYKIEYEKSDQYSKFQTDEIYFRDDRMDYITNEPTITGNATAIFVFGSLKKEN